MALTEEQIRELAQSATTQAEKNALAEKIVEENGESIQAAYALIALARDAEPI